jgi:hypothetical protein
MNRPLQAAFLPWSRRLDRALVALFAVSVGVAQTQAVLPPIAESLPGNAAVSMPLRWSHGTMQTIVDASLLPPGLSGSSITAVRLRRPAFLGEPAYGPVTRTITLRIGFGAMQARYLTSESCVNRPISGTPQPQPCAPHNSNVGTHITVGPSVYLIGASSAPSPGNVHGDDLLVIPLPTPLPVTAGNLFVEFEVTDIPMTIGDNWVDAVWMSGGVDRGYVVPVGDGSCQTSGPLELLWADSAPPRRGFDAQLQLRGGPANTPSYIMIGLDPLGAPQGPANLGFASDLGLLAQPLAGCHQWTPFDAVVAATTNAAGGLAITIPLPANLTGVGDEIGVQCATVDAQRAGLPLALSNGVLMKLDSAGIDDRCATAFFVGGATTSSWAPDPGLMPVLVLDY